MSVGVQRFFLYDEGEPSVGDFIKLSPEQILAIADFSDRNGFSGDPPELLSLAMRIGLSYEKTADLVQFAGFLDNEKNRLGLDPEGVVEEFEIYLRRKNLVDLQAKLPTVSPALKKLFAERPEIALRSKVASVTTGIVPVAIDFHSLCDLRPVFNEQRDNILDYVTVALVRVLVRSDGQQDSPVIFQIDRGGIDRLEEFLKRLRRKFSALEAVRNQLVGGKR
ncbi:MAG TPA: hypothetical protein VNF27_06135 [Candidatus Binataceae bacterium]|nr:hypothetical protein [Candidatus Binataceae bacterium]